VETSVPKIGDTVKARLFDGSEVSGKVVHVEQTAEGIRLRIVCGSVVNTVMLAQVVRP
jgi:hypothetical protein